MAKAYQNRQQIISDIKNKRYILERVTEEDGNLSREKRRKKLEKKVKKTRKEITKEKMLLLFELGKELKKDYNFGGNKYDKQLA